MNEDALKTSMRKFLKRVGVTSQQEIEKAIQAADAAGQLDMASLQAHVVLTVPELGLQHEIDTELKLEDE